MKIVRTILSSTDVKVNCINWCHCESAKVVQTLFSLALKEVCLFFLLHFSGDLHRPAMSLVPRTFPSAYSRILFPALYQSNRSFLLSSQCHGHVVWVTWCARRIFTRLETCPLCKRSRYKWKVLMCLSKALSTNENFYGVFIFRKLNFNKCFQE